MVKRSAGELLFAITVDRAVREVRSPPRSTAPSSSSSSPAVSQPEGCRRAAHRPRAGYLAHHCHRRVRAADVGGADRLAHRFRLLRLRFRRRAAAARRARRRAVRGRPRPSSPTSSPRPRRASSSGWRIRLNLAPSSPACRPTTPFRWRSGRGCRPSTGAQPRDLIMGYSDPERASGAAPGDRRASAGKSRHRLRCRADFHRQWRAAGLRPIGRVLINPGDPVWFENPGAIGARNSFIACGATMVAVPVDAEGISVEAGLRLAPDFRLAFVTPSHQHPTGVEMSLRAAPTCSGRQRARRLDRRGRLRRRVPL